jgi:hypothetical protein
MAGVLIRQREYEVALRIVQDSFAIFKRMLGGLVRFIDSQFIDSHFINSRFIDKSILST